MEPMVAEFRADLDPEVEFHTILTGWLPSPDLRSMESARQEWSSASAKTGARIDATYWDRVAPKTSLMACAAVKCADFQGAAKGLDYLAAFRQAIFRADGSPTNPETLTNVAKTTRLNEELFRHDLGVGRYAVDEVVTAVDPSVPLAEAVSWFARRRMLRSWEALAENLRTAQRYELASPAFHILRGKQEMKLRGLVAAEQLDRAIASVR